MDSAIFSHGSPGGGVEAGAHGAGGPPLDDRYCKSKANIPIGRPAQPSTLGDDKTRPLASHLSISNNIIGFS
jgi:hypothetical protein